VCVGGGGGGAGAGQVRVWARCARRGWGEALKGAKPTTWAGGGSPAHVALVQPGAPLHAALLAHVLPLAAPPQAVEALGYAQAAVAPSARVGGGAAAKPADGDGADVGGSGERVGDDGPLSAAAAGLGAAAALGAAAEGAVDAQARLTAYLAAPVAWGRRRAATLAGLAAAREAAAGARARGGGEGEHGREREAEASGSVPPATASVAGSAAPLAGSRGYHCAVCGFEGWLTPPQILQHRRTHE
jgi:hypothetical protein